MAQRQQQIINKLNQKPGEPEEYNGFMYSPLFKKSSSSDFRVLNGKAYYTRIASPITKLNTKEGLKDVPYPYFQTNIVINESQAEYLRDSVGIEVNDPTEGIPHYHVRMNKLVSRKGEDASRPGLFDKKGNDMDYKTLIGNGSTVSVLYIVNEAKNGKKYANLTHMQVIDLIPYESQSIDQEEEGGEETEKKPLNKSTKKENKKETVKVGDFRISSTQEELDNSQFDELDDDLPF